MLPDPGFLYLSKKHQMALTMLEYALYNNAGFCIISGEIGAGKTTLLRKLLESMEDHISVGMITNTHSSFGELLDWVLSAFNIHQPGMNKVEMHQIFLEYLLQQYSKKKTVVLIVDEAQNMSVDTLEELRMLSNINTGKDQLLQVILAGQPELKDTLRLPELKQFAQRIAVDYHLGALSIEETFGYIRHRLKTAGATRDIFTPLACERIHLYSGGVPRLINLLCDTSLVYGFADQAETIDENLVEEMVRERMSDSLVPIVHPADPAESPEPPATSPSGVSTRGTTPPPSKLSQISPEHKKQPVNPTAEKKTVADRRQPVALHPQAQVSGAQLKAVAAQHEPDPEELEEESIRETALASEPERAPEIGPEPAVEAEPAAEASAGLDETDAPSPQPAQPETVKQRLVNKIEVLKVVASEPESSWFGNKWIMGVLLVLALSVVFLLIRSTSSDSASQPVKTEASVVTSPQTTPAATTAPVTTTAAQPAAENSAAAARKKAIEAARQAAEQREAEAKVRREQEAAAAAVKAKAEAEAKAAAEAKAKVEQEKAERLKQAAAARKAERAQAAAKARAAELEAKLKAEQEAAARAREQAAAAEAKAQQAQAQARELQLKAQTTPAVTTSSVAASAKPASGGAQNVDPELEFTTDPCQGPSAKFLSTCRK